MYLSNYNHLLAEWHPTKNEDLTPDKISFGSEKKVWWICSKNSSHEWKSVVYSRTKLNAGCPYCFNKLPTRVNNLAAKFPVLVSQWHPTKNSELKPEQFLPQSSKKVWWKCNQGHEWLAKIQVRSLGHGCPYCTHQLADDENNLLITYPELAKELNYSRNKNIDFSKILPYSNKKVWWICSKGHEWNSTPNHRIARKQNCPYCSRKRASEEYNLIIKFPNLAKEWHPTKNIGLFPTSFLPMSSKKVWWICSKGHEWKTCISHRTFNLEACPYCVGKLVTSNNNLLVLCPEISKEWHPTKNKEFPNLVLSKSSKKVWWICKNNSKHEWESCIYNRTSNGSGCPYCCTTYTNLEQFVEEKLGIKKYNQCPLITSNIKYRPDFELISDNLYLNVDGLYWHSLRENTYHVKLRQAFEAENKRIFQFYEDEIYNKWNIVESIINNALGKSNKLFARNCEIKQGDSTIAQEFLNTNHLMGSYQAAKHYGLYLDNELISLMSIRQVKENIEIARFCNKINTSVTGGFQKLLSHVIKLYIPKQIISYCDLRYATGISYQKAGFKLVGITQGWQWSDSKQRFNRLYCKAGNGKTEKENAQEQGLVKLYDAGQAKYILFLL